MDLEKIYYKSPIWLQNIMTTAQGFLYKSARYGKVYRAAVEEYNKTDYTDYEALKKHQWERVSELVRYAVANTEFYKKFYEGIDIDEVLASGDITKLPILEKDMVRQNVEKMYAMPVSEGSISHTSGTTGKSICFLHSKTDLERRMAYLDHFKMQHGVTPMKMKRASFSSARVIPKDQKDSVHIYWRDNLAIKQRLYSGFHCTGNRVKYFAENLLKYKPQSMDGYPSAMYEVAKYIEDNRLPMTFKPIAIFPTAETLLPHYRDTIERVFGCKVSDQYASSEGAPFINECACGKLHYCMDTGYIEFMPDGRMLVTCFESHGTPLIRYDIGDKAFLSDNQACECGCKMPIVERIEGRTGDYIQSRTGDKVTAVYMSLVSGEFGNSIKGMQFIQNEDFSIDVNVEIEGELTDKIVEIIVWKLQYDVGDDIEIRVHKVNAIPREPSGKTRFIINKLAQNKK